MKGPAFYGQEFFTIKTDKELIRENLLRVLLTSPGERPMSNFGCRLKDYLFEPSTVLQQDVEDEVIKAITKWEPRVTIRNISVELVEERTARVKIDCMIKENFEDFNLDTILRF